MVLSRTHPTERSSSSPPPTVERRRGLVLGAFAGVIGLACCVGPAAAALVGFTSAAVAADLGNRLYSDWGWAFKIAAVVFALAALVVQRRRAAACPADRRPDLRRLTLWLAGTALIAYGLLYIGTKALERLA